MPLPAQHPLSSTSSTRCHRFRCSAASRRAPSQSKSAIIKTGGGTRHSHSEFLRLLDGAQQPTSGGSVERSLDDPITLAGNAVGAWWASIPARAKLVAACSSAFCMSNMDKVNMTVAGETSCTPPCPTIQVSSLNWQLSLQSSQSRKSSGGQAPSQDWSNPRSSGVSSWPR